MNCYVSLISLPNPISSLRQLQLELRQKVAATNAFQLNVLNKVENNALSHKQDEIRKQARHMLTVADHDSKQFRWYGKLQVALQFIEQQKEAVASMIAGGGIRDPHYSLEESIFEPSCRSLQEVRQSGERSEPQKGLECNTRQRQCRAFFFRSVKNAYSLSSLHLYPSPYPLTLFSIRFAHCSFGRSRGGTIRLSESIGRCW